MTCLKLHWLDSFCHLDTGAEEHFEKQNNPIADYFTAVIKTEIFNINDQKIIYQEHLTG